jgi:ELWxxDGT repeat protein
MGLVVAPVCAFAVDESLYRVELVSDIRPGPVKSSLSELTVYQDELIFAASNGLTGRELFRFEGGSVDLISNINPGVLDGAPHHLTLLGDSLYFSAQGPSLIGSELFRYDGSTIRLVEDLNPGHWGSHPSELTVFGDKLIFEASVGQSANPEELGIYDYNGARIRRVAGYSYAHLGLAHQFTPVNDRLYFRAGAPHGPELYVYDGLQASLVPGTNLNGGTNPLWMTSFQGSMFLQANDGQIGAELFTFDGTSFSRVADINPGEAGSAPRILGVFQNELIFSADDGVLGRELFSFDGSHVKLIADINPGSVSSNPTELVGFDQKVFFQAHNALTGSELYAYDGSRVTRITDLNPGPAISFSHEPGNLAAYNGELFFAANDGVHGEELFKLTIVPEPATLRLALLITVVTLATVAPRPSTARRWSAVGARGYSSRVGR